MNKSLLVISFLIFWFLCLTVNSTCNSESSISQLPNRQFQKDLIQENINTWNQFSPGTTVYFLKKGDTLYRLSQLYCVSLSELQSTNIIKDPRRLAENTKIYIPPVSYSVRCVQKYSFQAGDRLNCLLDSFQLDLQGFQRLNPSVNPEKINPGTIIFLPRQKLPSISRAKNSRGQYKITIIHPVRGVLSSRFGYRWGRMHYGIDLAAQYGTPVKAASPGTVIFAGWRGAYGQLIIINHGQFRTYYGHLSSIQVRINQAVNGGSVIGLVGASGRAYGSHLHFEVEQSGRKVNPLPYLMWN